MSRQLPGTEFCIRAPTLRLSRANFSSMGSIMLAPLRYGNYPIFFYCRIVAVHHFYSGYFCGIAVIRGPYSTSHPIALWVYVLTPRLALRPTIQLRTTSSCSRDKVFAARRVGACAMTGHGDPQSSSIDNRCTQPRFLGKIYLRLIHRQSAYMCRLYL